MSDLRTPEQMEWIRERFTIEGLARLARADRDYADDHGYYLPDVAALAHDALARCVAAEQALARATILADKWTEQDRSSDGWLRSAASAMRAALAGSCICDNPPLNINRNCPVHVEQAATPAPKPVCSCGWTRPAPCPVHPAGRLVPGPEPKETP